MPRPASHELPSSFILYLTVWGVELVASNQTSWLESTGVCGVQQLVRSNGFSWSLRPVSHDGHVEFLTEACVTTISYARVDHKAHNSLHAAGG